MENLIGKKINLQSISDLSISDPDEEGMCDVKGTLDDYQGISFNGVMNEEDDVAVILETSSAKIGRMLNTSNCIDY